MPRRQGGALPRPVNEHLANIYAERELDPEATLRSFRIVRTEGSREVSRTIDHYNLDTILAVGYRVRSARGTAFRQWATARLSELLTKGFTLDDERLEEGRTTPPPGSSRAAPMPPNPRWAGPLGDFDRAIDEVKRLETGDTPRSVSKVPKPAPKKATRKREPEGE